LDSKFVAEMTLTGWRQHPDFDPCFWLCQI